MSYYFSLRLQRKQKIRKQISNGSSEGVYLNDSIIFNNI